MDSRDLRIFEGAGPILVYTAPEGGYRTRQVSDARFWRSVMRTQVLLVLAAGLLVGADKPEGDTKKELKKFDGKWVAVAREMNGKKGSGDALKGFTFTVSGDQAVVIDGPRTCKATITVNPDKKPKQIDVSGKYGEKEIKTIGIYKFDGDKLTICYTMAENDRPKEFSTKGGTDEKILIMTVYKKQKKNK
jgi:uncharacterized protein (TIGR03067 family)